MTLPVQHRIGTPAARQQQSSEAGNDSQISPPANLTRPVEPLRWHECLHRHPELCQALYKGWSPPTPHRLAKLHRERLGKSPYGGWPGQRFLYEASDVAQLAALVDAEHRARFPRGVVR
jgi:hypothetical protein